MLGLKQEVIGMRRTVLLVERDAGRRSEVGDWLEDAGYEVMTCPGPSSPNYTCVGSTGAACPLAEGSDVVVLDMRLGSDDAMQGTPGWELLIYYMERGERIVALTAADDAVRPRTDDGVIVLDRPVEREPLIEAVGALANGGWGTEDGHDPAG
jgi:CheY-like chemotaxis protein